MTCRLNQAATYFEWLYRQRSSTSAIQHVTFNEIKDLAYGFMERVRRRCADGLEFEGSLLNGRRTQILVEHHSYAHEVTRIDYSKVFRLWIFPK